MRGLKKIFAVGLVSLFSLAPLSAKATSFVYQDADYGFQTSFPDSWLMQTTDTPTTRLLVRPPVTDDMASCRVKAVNDRRAVIYPFVHRGASVRNAVGFNFVDQKINENNNAEIVNYYPKGSMGKSDATFSQVKFDMYDDQGNAYRMHGVVLTAIYGENRYTFSCSAKESSYGRWEKVFGSIMGSVSLKEYGHLVPTGYYRDFLSDKEVKIPSVRGGNL